MILLKDVGKSYGNKLVFDNANMSIETAKPTVIMGKNGCGKSTLLKIIAGVLTHTQGEVIRPPKIKISFVPDRFPKLPFKVSEYITHMGKIQGLDDAYIKDYIDEQFGYLGIPESIKEQKIYKCSKGTIQKINIMQAFLTKPDLLVMDEPFSGLDESSIEGLIALLAKISKSETAIIISCHEKALAQRVAGNLFVFSGQSIVKSSDAQDSLCIKFIEEDASEELREIFVEKDRLKETLLSLLSAGHEIHSVNPISQRKTDA